MAELESLVGWRSLADAGVESCSLWRQDSGWRLEGTALRGEHQDSRMDYRICLSERWLTSSVIVRWCCRSSDGRHLLSRDDEDRWTLDGEPCGDLGGCSDVDLGFSPATNLMPIRRMLREGLDRLSLQVAWLRYPQMDVQPMEQSYERLDRDRFMYRSSTGFVAELDVDPVGMVRTYPGLWERV